MKEHSESIIAGGAVLGISALLFTQVLSGQFEGVVLARNPMTFPRFLLGLFALGGAGLLARGRFAARTQATVGERVAWLRVLGILVLAAIYLAVFAPLGFIPATLIFMPVGMLALGYRNPLVITLVTIVTVPLLWYAFAEAFSIRPPGIGIDDMLRQIGGGA